MFYICIFIFSALFSHRSSWIKCSSLKYRSIQVFCLLWRVRDTNREGENWSLSFGWCCDWKSLWVMSYCTNMNKFALKTCFPPVLRRWCIVWNKPYWFPNQIENKNNFRKFGVMYIEREKRKSEMFSNSQWFASFIRKCDCEAIWVFHEIWTENIKHILSIGIILDRKCTC